MGAGLVVLVVAAATVLYTFGVPALVLMSTVVTVAVTVIAASAVVASMTAYRIHSLERVTFDVDSNGRNIE